MPFASRNCENAGIQALTLHGRTRACDFDDGTVEYDSIRDVKANVGIPGHCQ